MIAESQQLEHLLIQYDQEKPLGQAIGLRVVSSRSVVFPKMARKWGMLKWLNDHVCLLFTGINQIFSYTMPLGLWRVYGTEMTALDESNKQTSIDSTSHIIPYNLPRKKYKCSKLVSLQSRLPHLQQLRVFASMALAKSCDKFQSHANDLPQYLDHPPVSTLQPLQSWNLSWPA